MHRSIIWFEIHVANMNRAKKFYENVFNIKLNEMESSPQHEMWGFPNHPSVPGSCGALVRRNDFPPGRNSTLVYFDSDDCAMEEKLVLENGGKIDQTKSAIGIYGFVTIAIDTEGNRFGIFSIK